MLLGTIGFKNPKGVIWWWDFKHCDKWVAVGVGVVEWVESQGDLITPPDHMWRSFTLYLEGQRVTFNFC